MRMRLRDLTRMRELIRTYGRDGELRIATMPEPARTEAREISDRIGELDPGKRQARQEILLTLARMEAFIDDLPVTSENAAEIRRLRADISRQRSELTGLPPEPGTP
jgi:hypothetical protein